MRKDMYKVIVERPRRGGGYRSEIPMPVDLDDSPRQEGLKRRHRSQKWLNENLRPLERYLAAQVGRPWDKVYSEICAGIDRRNTVQQHVHQHLEDFVAMKVMRRDGILVAVRRWGRLQAIADAWGPAFYVDPDSGLLRINKGKTAALREAKRRRQRSAALRYGGHREDLRWIDDQWQLHRIRGLWYRVEVAAIREIDPRQPEPVDAIRRIPLHQCPTHTARKGIDSNLWLFGAPDLYAVRKRQLDAKELRHHRLQNDAPRDS